MKEMTVETSNDATSICSGARSEIDYSDYSGDIREIYGDEPDALALGFVGGIAPSEVLEVSLAMLRYLPDDEDNNMHLSFEDNGGPADGNMWLLADYTPAQRGELIKRGAIVRQARKINYRERLHRTILKDSSLDWCGIQIANEAWVIVPADNE